MNLIYLLKYKIELGQKVFMILIIRFRKSSSNRWIHLLRMKQSIDNSCVSNRELFNEGMMNIEFTNDL
jgi:hypothetical protein